MATELKYRTSHQGTFADLAAANALIALEPGGVVGTYLIWKCIIDGAEYKAITGAAVFTPVIEPWDTSPTGQLVPTVIDVGIGSVTQFPSHVVLGDTSTGESEGMIKARPVADGGGIIIAGAHAFDPEAPGADPVNAPVEIAGSSVWQTGEVFLMEVEEVSTVDRYVTMSPTFTLADGRIFTSLQAGGEVQFEHEQSATDARNILLNDAGPLISVVSLTTDFEYPAGSQIQISLLLEETANRDVLIDIVVQVATVEVARQTIALRNGQQQFNINDITSATITNGQLVDVLAEFNSTGPAGTVRVRGDLQTSTLSVRATAAAAVQAANYVRLPVAQYNDTIPAYIPFGPIAQLIGLKWADYGPDNHVVDGAFRLIPLDVMQDVSPLMIALLILGGFEVLPMPLP